MRIRSAALLLGLLTLLRGTGVAFAAEPSAATSTSAASAPSPEGGADERHEKARALFREGNEAYRARELERARSLYQEGLRYERAFDLVCNLGRTEADLRDDALALSHLDECLKEYPPGDTVAAAREKFFNLREAVRERCKTKSCVVKTPAGASSAPSSTAPATSEQTPSPKAEPAASPTRSAASRESSRAEEGTSWKWPVTIGVGVLGLAATGAGFGLWLSADAREDEAKLVREAIVRDGGSCGGASPHPSCANFEEIYGSANTNSTLGVVGFASGGALLAGAALLAVFWEPTTTESGAASVRLIPHVSGSALGATMMGTF